ncbi:MAG: adenosine deaminase [Peptostreptococcus sp.]|uniref:adenosine deaminase n=1 Tax=Peptostreptococcus sp. TaxID=1262 RepID=UPI002FC6CD4F
MKKTLTKKQIEKLPKIELHCHLDGSLRKESVLEEIELQKLDLTSVTLENIDEFLQAPKDSTSLLDYLKAFDLPLKILQTEGAIERFTYEVYEDAFKENIVYMELRFAPILHTNEFLSMEEVIQAAIRGLNKAKKEFPIDGGLILCCMKNFTQEDAIATIKVGKNYLDKGVCGVDLAGPEDEAFAYKFIEAMNLADKYGYNITIHAGEAASAQNVSDSINLLHAKRIGHGVRSIDSEIICEEIRSSNILLEICPTSNIQTKTVDSMEKHPLINFFEEDILFSVNTDNRTVSATTLSKEYEIVSKLIDMNLDDYKKMYYNTVGAIFASDKVKGKLLDIFEKSQI